MNLSEIFKEVKSQISFEDLIPLTDVVTKKDKKNLKEKGYALIEFTLEEFKEKFKGINPNHIYYSNSISLLNALYIDLDKFVCASLPLYGDNVIGSSNSESDEKALLDIINRYLNAYENKKFNQLLFLCPTPLKMELFFKMMASKKIEHPYELFIDVYTGAEYDFDKFGIDLITEIYNKRTESELLEFKERIKDLPDNVTIYRGEGDIRRELETCYSWTLDENVANFFATRHSQERARILKGTIAKEDILDYLTDRNEEEILVNPINIKDVEIKEFPTISNVDTFELMLAQTVLRENDELIHELYKEKINSEHDENHIKRVLLLACLIYLKSNFEYDFSEELYSAIVFHDAGRDDDYTDEEHGEKSLDIYRKYTEENISSDITEFLIKYHCIDDKIGIKYIEENFDKEDINSVKLLYSVIKDADALDRVRFGLGGLDVNFLRNDISKDLIFVAKQLLNYRL